MTALLKVGVFIARIVSGEVTSIANTSVPFTIEEGRSCSNWIKVIVWYYVNFSVIVVHIIGTLYEIHESGMMK